MPGLRVRELAEAQGLNMSQLQKKAQVTMPSVRRYWYNTRDGKTTGEPLREIDLGVLGAIAKVLGVKISELIEDSFTLYAAALDKAQRTGSRTRSARRAVTR